MRRMCVRVRRMRRCRVRGGWVLTVYSMVVGEGRRICKVGGQVSMVDALIDSFLKECEVL